jgi:Cu+-exporting ATPase
MNRLKNKDPVCGMDVNPQTTPYQYEHYFFCSSHCLERFKKNPQQFLKPIQQDDDQGLMQEYTCPMHPEVITNQPGFCPICGMALEPRVMQTGEEDKEELTLMTQRFWISAVLTLPLFILAMFHLQVFFLSAHQSLFLQAILATGVVLWGGWPLLERAWRSIIQSNLNMFTLIGLGISVAYVYSLTATFAPFLFPSSFYLRDGTLPIYFEAASVITTLALLGQMLELRARNRMNQSLKALFNLSPKTAHLIQDNQIETTIALTDVKIGDRLRVKPGEQIPVDGLVIEGKSTVDESMMTGESIPVEKHTNDPIIGGTLNKTGTFLMKAEKVGRDTLLARIIRLVGEAQRSRLPIQRLVDRISQYFVPFVLFIALLTFLIWFWIGSSPSYGLLNAVAVLMIACPCALGLATPVSIIVGIGRGATSGILIRHAEALETMAKVDTIVIDKTGTLTEGKLSLSSLISSPGFSQDTLLQFSASLEAASEHALAEPIMALANQKNLALLPVEDFDAIPGQGIKGSIQNKKIALGNHSLMSHLQVDLSSFVSDAKQLQKQGQIVMYLAIDGQCLGLLAVRDRVKSSAKLAVQELHQEGLRLIMLTGDHPLVAESVVKQLGIDEFKAEMLPQDKNQTVKDLQEKGHLVAMAGDGVNDAPALAQANVGIAMGTGADVSMESASITLIQSDLRGLVRLRKLSQATLQNIKQNLIFAFIYNVLCIPIAAGLFYPIFGLLLNPMIASAAMALSSISVILNALRLRDVKL